MNKWRGGRGRSRWREKETGKLEEGRNKWMEGSDRGREGKREVERKEQRRNEINN